jgi:hypothetical protein
VLPFSWTLLAGETPTNRRTLMRMRNRASVFNRLRPGKASDFIDTWDTLKPGDKVILALRESHPEQWPQIDDQEFLVLRPALKAIGVKVIGVIDRLGHGVVPIWLNRSAARAEKLGAKIVAESTDRLIRPSDYSKYNQEAQARTDDLEELRFYTLGVPLVTFVHPDASPSEVRAHQSSRSGKKGGRRPKPPAGYKKRRRKQMRPIARRMTRRGYSLNDIAAETGLPRSTIQRWTSDIR